MAGRPYTKDEEELAKNFFKKALNENVSITNEDYQQAIHLLKLIEITGDLPQIFKTPFRDGEVNKDGIQFAKLKLMNRILLSIQPNISGDNTVIRSIESNLSYMLLESIRISDKVYDLDKNGNVNFKPILYLRKDDDKRKI